MFFWIVFIPILVIPFAYMFLIGKTAYVVGEVDERTRENYFDVVRNMVTAAGVAIAIVAAGFQQKIAAPVWVLRRATVYLSLCVMLSVTTMLEMSRSYEEARRSKEGKVRPEKLIPVLALGYVALVTFLLGFAYLARLTYYV